MITLRADFYDRPLQYPDFGELVRSRMETILPLSADGLERAIAKPAEQAGLRFDPGLVASIVAEVNYQAGALPLLQYALTELFERREGRTLTQAAYQTIGGTGGALAKRAEEIYQEFGDVGKEAVRQLFLRLVTLGEGVADTRRRVQRSELLDIARDADEMDEAIDTFAAYRLLTLDNDPGTRSPTVEVAHEAILREWRRLSNWITESREDIKMQQQLNRIAAEWQEKGREASYLASGQRLEQIEGWATSKEQALTALERAYLEASLAEREQQQSVETERQARETRLERRSRRILQGLIVVLLLATLGAFGLTAVAQTARQEAENQANLALVAQQQAEDQARIATARELVGYANANLNTDAELSTLLAMQAVNMTYAADGSVLPEAEQALHQAVGAMHTPLRLSPSGEGSDANVGFRFTQDGALLAYHLINGDVFGKPSVTGIADAKTGQLLYQLPGSIDAQVLGKDEIITSVPVNGNMEIEVWDISSRDHGTLLSSTTEPYDVWHSPDGAFFLQANWTDMSPNLTSYFASMGDGHNRIWDLTTGNEIVTAATQKIPDGNGKPLFSPDGTRLANLNPDGTLRILDTTTWEEIARLSPPNTVISGNYSFGFSGNSQRFAAPNANNTVTIWDTTTGAELYTLYPGFTPRLIALDNDGTRVALGTNTGQVVIWNTTTKTQEFALGVSYDASSIAFSPDGTRLAVSHGYGNEIWNLVPGQEALTLVNHDSDEESAAVGLAYSPDGRRILATGTSTNPNVWDVQTGQKLLTLAGHTARVRAAAWSPDGTLLATGGEDQTAILWDATTGARKLTLTGHTDHIFAIAFSPDSHRLGTASLDGSLRIWDVHTGELVFAVAREGVQATRGVAWSPDGLHIAITTLGIDALHGAHLYILNALTGETEHDTALGDTGIGHLMYSPDGTRIAAAMSDGQVFDVIDAHTGEKVLTLPGHGVTAAAIAFSPDEALIATGGFDNLAQLWDANTGKELLKLTTPLKTTYRVAFSPDGSHLAIQDQDSTTMIYVVHIEDLLSLAKSRLTRTFTTEECQQYLHTDTCPAD
jgi:WD40 repeat protein